MPSVRPESIRRAVPFTAIGVVQRANSIPHTVGQANTINRLPPLFRQRGDDLRERVPQRGRALAAM